MMADFAPVELAMFPLSRRRCPTKICRCIFEPLPAGTVTAWTPRILTSVLCDLAWPRGRRRRYAVMMSGRWPGSPNGCRTRFR